MITMRDGLLSHRIRRIYQAQDDSVWVAYQKKGAGSLRDGRWVNHTYGQGLPDAYINFLGEDADGELYILSGGGNVYRLIEAA